MEKTSHSHKKEIIPELPVEVVFVRHAQAGGDDVSPELGPPLTSLGRRQAERVARRLAAEPFDQIYSSDLARAWETTQEILKHQPDIDCTLIMDLREVASFHFTGEPSPARPFDRKALKQEEEALHRFARLIRGSHKPGERVLVVGHGNAIRTLVPILAGKDPAKTVLMELNNTAVTVLDLWPTGAAVLKLANCIRHLLPSQVTT